MFLSRTVRLSDTKRLIARWRGYERKSTGQKRPKAFQISTAIPPHLREVCVIKRKGKPENSTRHLNLPFGEEANMSAPLLYVRSSLPSSSSLGNRLRQLPSRKLRRKLCLSGTSTSRNWSSSRQTGLHARRPSAKAALATRQTPPQQQSRSLSAASSAAAPTLFGDTIIVTKRCAEVRQSGKKKAGCLGCPRREHQQQVMRQTRLQLHTYTELVHTSSSRFDWDLALHAPTERALLLLRLCRVGNPFVVRAFDCSCCGSPTESPFFFKL